MALNTGFFCPISDVLLRRLNWTVPVVIDSVMTSDETSRGRPYPDMILKLTDRFGVADAGKVARVGNTMVELQKGTHAGCALVIGVTTGSFSRAQLLTGPHTYIVNSVAEVPSLILTH